MKQYHYQVRCRISGGSVRVYSGAVSANSEAEVAALLRKSYANIVEYHIW